VTWPELMEHDGAVTALPSRPPVGVELEQLPAGGRRCEPVEQVERRLTQLLGGWAALSLVAGSALWRAPRTRGQERTRDFGRQTAFWGAVNSGIAGVGAVRRARGHRTSPRRLRRVLLVNAGLDVGYVAGGLALLSPPSRLPVRPRPGDAVAIVVQGLFLLALDGWAARRLSR
jgi:hypothetical protein